MKHALLGLLLAATTAAVAATTITTSGVVWYAGDECSDEDIKLVFVGDTCYPFVVDAESISGTKRETGKSLSGNGSHVVVWEEAECQGSGNYIYLSKDPNKCGKLAIYNGMEEATVTVTDPKGNSFVFTTGKMAVSAGQAAGGP